MSDLKRCSYCGLTFAPGAKFCSNCGNPSASTPKRSEVTDEEPGPIAAFGLLIGGGFGVILVIAAFLDPTFEGRIYLFLPAIILGVLGHLVGSAIEKVIRRLRKKS